jgi:hypothetical protein
MQSTSRPGTKRNAQNTVSSTNQPHCNKVVVVATNSDPPLQRLHSRRVMPRRWPKRARVLSKQVKNLGKKSRHNYKSRVALLENELRAYKYAQHGLLDLPEDANSSSSSSSSNSDDETALLKLLAFQEERPPRPIGRPPPQTRRAKDAWCQHSILIIILIIIAISSSQSSVYSKTCAAAA